jgi:fructokinase
MPNPSLEDVVVGMRLGIDLGGTKIELVALSYEGSTLLRRRVPTPSGNYSEILQSIKELVCSAEEQLGQSGTVGVASPGAISKKSGLVKNSNSTVLNGKPLHSDLSQALGRSIRIENDANCFALSEAIDGAGINAKAVFGVILGTGVGAGLVVDKQLISGRNRIAGEWGHNPLPWAGDKELANRSCYCGKSGCIETFLSGGALARDYCTITGRNVTAQEVGAAAAAGDDRAIYCIGRYQDRLGRSLASVINVFDPDLIVLGGGLSNLPQIYIGLTPVIERYAFSDQVDTCIAPAEHGDSSGVRGAAWLWPSGQKPI